MIPRLLAMRGWVLLALLVLLLMQWGLLVAPAATSARAEDVHTVPRAARPARVRPISLGARPNLASPAQLSIEPYVRPEMAQRMEWLRPTILAAAQRHNRAELSGMSDEEFAALIALVLYNENFGWLEDDIVPLRLFAPLYQDLQRQANQSQLGSDFSVWPANLRPSVALEIVGQRLPVRDGQVISVPVRVHGSQIDPLAYGSRETLFAALTAEISHDEMAVEYLAANLERGLFRASAEQAPVSWRTLAAWHNQGIVSPRDIRANGTARDYVRRASAYLQLARKLVAPRPPPRSPLERV